LLKKNALQISLSLLKVAPI